jgi:hypothetical protein
MLDTGLLILDFRFRIGRIQNPATNRPPPLARSAAFQRLSAELKSTHFFNDPDNLPTSRLWRLIHKKFSKNL